MTATEKLRLELNDLKDQVKTLKNADVAIDTRLTRLKRDVDGRLSAIETRLERGKK